MPKAASCSFSRCANGLKSSERENFKPLEEAHWRACHVDEPVKFTCRYTGHNVELRRNAARRYLFTCVCGQSRLLNSGSVKRHDDICRSIRRQVIQDRESRSGGESLDDPAPISKPENSIREFSPAMSSASGVIPYSDSKSTDSSYILTSKLFSESF
jgi:hypothetical protein